MIQVEHLSKAFLDYRRGWIPAVHDVSFECRPGEIFGLLGPNGAGKTTTLRILSTVLRPTGGRAIVAGHDVVLEPEAVRAAARGRATPSACDCGGYSFTSSATGKAVSSAETGTDPSCHRTPVRRSRQPPAGSSRAVSRQPLAAARRSVSRGTTVITPSPRWNETTCREAGP